MRGGDGFLNSSFEVGVAGVEVSESGREGREKKQERERENESQRRTTTTAARQRQQQTLPPQPPPPLKRLLPHSQRGGGIREQLEQERSSRQRRPSVDDSRRFFLSFRSRRQDSRVSSSRLFFSLFLSLSLSLPPCFSHPISSADPNESKRKRAEKIEHVPKRLLSPLPLSLSLSQKTKKKTKEKIRRTRTRSSTPSTAQARPSAGRTRPLPHREGRRPPCLPPRAARWRGAAGRKPERGTERTQGCDEGAASRGRRRTILWARGSPREGWRLPFRGWGSRA